MTRRRKTGLLWSGLTWLTLAMMFVVARLLNRDVPDTGVMDDAAYLVFVLSLTLGGVACVVAWWRSDKKREP